jgi:hypothetical protein
MPTQRFTVTDPRAVSDQAWNAVLPLVHNHTITIWSAVTYVKDVEWTLHWMEQGNSPGYLFRDIRDFHATGKAIETTTITTGTTNTDSYGDATTLTDHSDHSGKTGGKVDILIASFGPEGGFAYGSAAAQQHTAGTTTGTNNSETKTTQDIFDVGQGTISGGTLVERADGHGEVYIPVSIREGVEVRIRP